MRPTEMKNLCCGDVLQYRAGRKKPIGERDITIRVRGKGKSREFVPLQAAISASICSGIFVHHMKADPKDTDPVLATKQGQRSGSSAKGFGEVLSLSGVERDYRGVKCTMYSFRHFYISQQLAHGVDVFVLARNTGTSSEMIDKFYGQVANFRMKDRLRPEWNDV